MDSADIVLALCHAYPDASWIYEGDGSSLKPHGKKPGPVYRGLTWDGEGDPPTLAELQAIRRSLGPPS